MSKIQSLSINYTHKGYNLEGSLVYDAECPVPVQGVLMAPNWMGVSASAIHQAAEIARKGFAVFVADLYGQDLRPSSAEEAGLYMSQVKDTSDEVGRMVAAMHAFRAQNYVDLKNEHVAVIGFCFGGHCALEMARSGAEISVAVSFHGMLDSCGAYLNERVQCPVLVLHGADDPLIPSGQLNDFVKEMASSGTDWKLHSYAGAVHSFTEPDASTPGISQYNEDVARRAFSAMYSLLNEIS